MTSLMKKYTTKERTFKMAPDNRFITVYINSRVNGLIWNTDTVISLDGEEIISSVFFK